LTLDIGSTLGIERLDKEQDSYEKNIRDLTESNNQLLRKINETRGELAYWEAECNKSKSNIYLNYAILKNI
jgi:hypothetical protein